MIYIYSPHTNRTRLTYAATHIFTNILGTSFEITDDREYFSQQKELCINYSTEQLNHALQIIPQGLLFETGVNKPTPPATSVWKGTFCFFAQNDGDIPFDLFSATFYLLTLYDEFFPKELDEHERFDHKESLLFKNGSLEVPVIDRWAYSLKEEWEKKGDNTSGFQLRKYRSISTFDIDHPYLYWNKGLIKTFGNLTRDLFNIRFRSVIARLAVNLKLGKDPYFEALKQIESVHKHLGRTYYLFILMGEDTPMDRSTAVSPHRYYNYLKDLSGVEIGLHPSYNTLRNLSLLKKEKKEFEEILRRKANATRQHFLRMQSPETFEELTLVGFGEDFSLSFAQVPGFRSGTAVPYSFYDIDKEKTTPLLIRPSIAMDSTFIFHQKKTPEETLLKMKQLTDECKQSGGDYVSIWHNSNLAPSLKNPWVKVWEESLTYSISLEND